MLTKNLSIPIGSQKLFNGHFPADFFVSNDYQ